MDPRPALCALSLLGGCSGPVPVAIISGGKPMRVMSINQCTDQLVLALLPPDRIASVSWLARDPSGSLLVRQAMRVGTNRGTAEDVVRQHPDLVIAGSFSTPATRGLLKRIGYRVLEVDEAQSLDQIRTVTRQVAHAVGEVARGEALIARMDRQMAALARDPIPAIRIAAWDGGGFNASKGSLYDAVIAAAGAINVANEAPASGYGKPDTEVLLAAAPALLIEGSAIAERPSLRDNVGRHPLVRRYWGARTVRIRPAAYSCGTPMIADAVIALRRQLRAATAAAGVRLSFARRSVS